MKRGLLNALIFLTFSGTSLLGQGQADNWFDQGNQLYKNEQYQAAIMRWEAVFRIWGAQCGDLLQYGQCVLSSQ